MRIIGGIYDYTSPLTGHLLGDTSLLTSSEIGVQGYTYLTASVMARTDTSVTELVSHSEMSALKVVVS